MARWLLALCLLQGCAPKTVQHVTASWYGKELRGNPTASGERFRPSKRTAAHKTLPFGTVLKVTSVATGESVRVVINDRGPFVAGRELDLSRKAAKRIGLVDQGVGEVRYKVVGCKARYDDC
jgi:rare lipoprotein A